MPCDAFMISAHLNELHGWIMASGVLHVKRRHRYQKKAPQHLPFLWGIGPIVVPQT